MLSLLLTLVLLVSRYLHVVSTTLLVGGTLFYEMVVPIAIDELRDEQKLFVFARARWVFKWIVWTAAAMILVSGAISTWDHWDQYTGKQYLESTDLARLDLPRNHVVPAAGRPGWWWAAHASTGVIAVMIALALTIGPVPPSKPVRWMRFNLVILLLVVFLATATRYARLQAETGRPRPQSIQHMGD